MQEEIKGGLTDLPHDDRDFSLGALYDLPPAESLPPSYILPYIVKHQGDSDFCSAYASCAASEVQEEIELEPAYSFAVSKSISGNVDAWGQNLRDAMKAHVKVGALPKTLSPYSVESKSDTFLRRLENWNISERLTAPQKKKSYVKITGPYDAFDNIRASLIKFKTPIVTGIKFGYPVSEQYFDEPKEGTGHAMAVIGYRDENYLTLLNSYGGHAGNGGLHYVSRKVINTWAPKFGAYTFVDLSKEEAQAYLKEQRKVDHLYILRMIRRGIRKLNELLV